MSGPLVQPLLLAPAERADLVCDFTGIAAGTEFILYNDAPGPFPGGGGSFDYYPGNPETPTSTPGYGPNTRTLLKIRVKAPTGTVKALNPFIRLSTRGLKEVPLVNQIPFVPTPIPNKVRVSGVTYPVTVRTLTLNEGFDEYGRLAQFLGSDTVAPNSIDPAFFGRTYLDTPTENVAERERSRSGRSPTCRPIPTRSISTSLTSRSSTASRSRPPGSAVRSRSSPRAARWRPTLTSSATRKRSGRIPDEVIAVIMKFDLPKVPFTVPASPRTGGHEYVWHCHILEHEEHDMMRPLVVT